MMPYPQPEPWRQWPHEKQISYLEGLVAAERETARRVTMHWLRAADRVKELEQNAGARVDNPLVSR